MRKGPAWRQAGDSSPARPIEPMSASQTAEPLIGHGNSSNIRPETGLFPQSAHKPSLTPAIEPSIFVQEKRKAKMCYTGFALSDLAVSGGLPFIPASLPGTDFPPSPYSVYLISLPPGDIALDRQHVQSDGSSFAARLEWSGRSDSKASGARKRAGYSIFGIAVVRKHELKWIFHMRKPPCTPFIRTT